LLRSCPVGFQRLTEDPAVRIDVIVEDPSSKESFS